MLSQLYFKKKLKKLYFQASYKFKDNRSKKISLKNFCIFVVILENIKKEFNF
jgi:hypothetical protein